MKAMRLGAMRCALLLMLSIAATPALGQEVRGEVWAASHATARLGQVELSLDSTARFAEGALYEWTQGGFIGTDAGGADLAIGYQHIFGYAAGRVSRTENRIREQASFTLAGPLSARIRFEQRFRSDGSDMGLRLRGRLHLAQPVGRIKLVGWHESFFELNDTDWGQDAGWRRMRNFAGIELPLARRLSVQAGYLNQYDFARSGGRDAMANVASFSVAARF